MQKITTHFCHGGHLHILQHESKALGCVMQFSLFLPPQAQFGKVPFVTYLSGLTCTHENFTSKAGAYAIAADLGIAIIAPDTSPRGEAVADDPESYDFGKGAGFYINATQAPWSQHYQMETYIAEELNILAVSEFPLKQQLQGILGHSMGGHGALTLGLKYPDLYRSISAFAPIVAPASVAWGQKAFTGYLGDDISVWQHHDATELMKRSNNANLRPEILIDQGLSDQFLESQLKPHLFEQACQQVGQRLNLRLQEEYDHSYFFIQSFIKDHLHHHGAILK